jgi:hypothetical protein
LAPPGGHDPRVVPVLANIAASGAWRSGTESREHLAPKLADEAMLLHLGASVSPQPGRSAAVSQMSRRQADVGPASGSAGVLVAPAHAACCGDLWRAGGRGGQYAPILTAVAPFLLVGLVAALGFGRALYGLALGEDLWLLRAHDVRLRPETPASGARRVGDACAAPRRAAAEPTGTRELAREVGRGRRRRLAPGRGRARWGMAATSTEVVYDLLFCSEWRRPPQID